MNIAFQSLCGSTQFGAQQASVPLILKLMCRGAGQEVGRSCHLLEFKGKKILVGDVQCGKSLMVNVVCPVQQCLHRGW